MQEENQLAELKLGGAAFQLVSDIIIGVLTLGRERVSQNNHPIAQKVSLPAPTGNGN